MATGYIIQPWDFSVVQSVNVTDYDLPLECYSGETGSVTFEGKGLRDYSQYIFRLDVLDTMWKIKEAETGDALSTKLTVTDQTAILDGAIATPVIQGVSYSNDLTAQQLNAITGYMNAETSGRYDVQYSKYLYPYIGPKGTSLPNILTGAGLKTADYLLYNESLGNNTRYMVTDLYKLVTDLVGIGAKLAFSVGDRAPRSSTGISLLYTLTERTGYSIATPIFFNDGHSYLLTESYDGDVCSCFIGVHSYSMAPLPYRYYLDENMQMVQNKDEQINGYTKTETVSSTADAQDKAMAAFGANQWKHKVEFASDKVFHLNQPVRLMLERGILNTAISKVTIKSKDDRYYYTCGDLPQTAAQHIKANSWSYGSRLPHNPYAGQLAFI